MLLCSHSLFDWSLYNQLTKGQLRRHAGRRLQGNSRVIPCCRCLAGGCRTTANWLHTASMLATNCRTTDEWLCIMHAGKRLQDNSIVLCMAMALIFMMVLEPAVNKNPLPLDTGPVWYLGYHNLPPPGLPSYPFSYQLEWEGWTA